MDQTKDKLPSRTFIMKIYHLTMASHLILKEAKCLQDEIKQPVFINFPH